MFVRISYIKNCAVEKEDFINIIISSGIDLSFGDVLYVSTEKI